MRLIGNAAAILNLMKNDIDVKKWLQEQLAINFREGEALLALMLLVMENNEPDEGIGIPDEAL